MSEEHRRTPGMHRYQHLTVALTRNEADPGLLRYVARIAQLGTAREIHFVHVLPEVHDPAAVKEHDQADEQLRAEVRMHFGTLPDNCRAHFDVLRGPILDRLLRFVAEQDTDLLFVGHRPHLPGGKALARRLAMKASCSIWMVPDGFPPTLDQILVPIDFSEHSADTFRVAVTLARSWGQSTCLPLHVYFNAATVSYASYEEVLRGEERQAYERFVQGIDCQGVTIRPLFEESADVAHMIHRVVENRGIDLVAIGTRGRSRSAAVLLGSVTEDTITQTRVPILVVKHFGAQMGFLEALLKKAFLDKDGPTFD